MDRSFLLFLTLLSMPMITRAQPVLTLPTDAPTPGDYYVVSYGAYQPAGNAGTGQTWDFGDLVVDSTGTLSVQSPGSVAGGADYPTATSAVVAADGTRFYQVTSNELLLLGNVLLGQSAPYTNAAKSLEFPCTYQTTWQDTYAGNLEFFGFPLQLSGTIDAEADGYGTLALPEGIATDVLRIRTVDVATIITILGDFEIVTETYSFHKPGISLPLLTISRTDGEVLGEPLLIESLQWIDLSQVGIAENGNPENVLVFPNPTNGAFSIVVPSAFPTGGAITVSDTQGRIVWQQSYQRHSMGPEAIGIDLSGLRAGLYLARLNAPDGQHRMGRILLQGDLR